MREIHQSMTDWDQGVPYSQRGTYNNPNRRLCLFGGIQSASSNERCNSPSSIKILSSSSAVQATRPARAHRARAA